MESREALIVLNMLERVGPIRLRRLLCSFDSPQAILAAGRTKLSKINGIGEEVAESIADWRSSIDIESELKRIDDYGCSVVTQEDECYPEALRQIYDPPIVLYVKGRLKKSDKNSIAMVGSRLTTQYGREAARRISYQLSGLGVTVISGGARGIDTAAHQGALSGGGRTIAVLGTGMNIVFPPENKDLFDRISHNGAVITQFPFNRQADRRTFPVRNRIVAGITLGTVVVEANLTSGALITANMAVDYGRQLYAVPGRIDSPRSRGCHELIKKGAKLCENAQDILSEFEYLFPTSEFEGGHAPAFSPETVRMNENEKTVFALLADEQLDIDEIIRRSSLPSADVSVALLTLEMKKLIRQMPGKIFAVNRI
ncbi:MAG: DNA-processing protein DprA [Verrucomicrobia bacterium]|nr:DNA-processing protein DprA [Verrucomicrobiota bacterium]MCF7708810.1 DNA-processing protein DprA [Verrucomicrobiota bacterium]